MATPILVSQKFDTAPHVPAFAYTAIAITNGLAGKHLVNSRVEPGVHVAVTTDKD